MLCLQPLIRAAIGGVALLLGTSGDTPSSDLSSSSSSLSSFPRIDSVKLVASTRWLKLKTLLYTDQDGKPREWNVVSRTTKHAVDKADAVVIIPLLKKAGSNKIETLLVEQYRPPVGRMAVSFPAGLIDGGESPEDAALRELREETGFVGEKCALISPEVCMSPGMSDASAHCVLVDVDLDNPYNVIPRTELDEGEFITVKRVDLREVLKDMLDGNESMPHMGLYLFAIGFELGKTLSGTSKFGHT